MASVDRKDVQKWAREDAPIVRVEGIERGREEDPSSASSGKSRAHSSERQAHVHEGDNIKTSYDIEEDVPPSLFQKLKGAFLGAEDKARPKDELHAKDADPHPALSPEAPPSRLSNLQQRILGSSDQAKLNTEAVSSSIDAPEESANPKGSSSLPGGKDAFDSSELGTGYEEDTEKGTLSSGSSLDSNTSSQPQSLFQPVKENKESDLTLEDLRASKTSHQTSSPDDVKAPGVLGRASEEVEAVTDQVTEALNLKDKRSASDDQKDGVNQSGFFSRIAEKIGYGGGGIGRSQSQ